MTREKMLNILVSEIEKAEGLPPNAAKACSDLRDGIISPGFAAVLNAMERAIKESKP